MIIPSIDLIKGCAVQLVGGKEENLKVNAGDPVPIAKKFRIAGEIAVVDLDAALSKGSNKETILKLIQIASCRVGGGIRDVETALYWLNAGAAKIVLGTAARRDILEQLPRERIVAALDAVNGEVVVKGWTETTGKSIFEKVEELKDLVGGFLVTFVEREGRMGGVDLELIANLKAAVGDKCVLTIAGGVTTVDEIAALHKMGVEAQVGMALYTDRMDLGDAISACAVSDRPDNLIPTVVVDEQGVALGLVYSDKESIRAAVKNMKGVYHSRNRGLWFKGETSGATQDLLRIELDCDSDALCFVVHQNGNGFCHFDRRSCFQPLNSGLGALMRTLESRKVNSIEGSYTNRLFNDAKLLHSKIVEEATELVEANTKEEITWEAADVIYFTLVKCAKEGVALSDIEKHLDLRALKVTRRAGDAKEPKKEEKAATASVVPKEAQAQVQVPPKLKRLSVSEVQVLENEAVDERIIEAAKGIVDDVRKRGDEALLYHAKRLGDIKEGEPLIWDRDRLKKNFDELPIEQQEMLKRTTERISRFAQAQRDSIEEITVNISGGQAGHTISPVSAAGCYAPGGRFPLPSSVLMTVVTARVAGVKRVWVASPRPQQITAAAAYIAGADALLAVGGAHAIAALAYGTQTIPGSDAVVGPGNKWVTAAKSLVNGKVKIDMLAGPSECLVIADHTAIPELVAADLLAQAEHDPDARPLLISIKDEGLADKVDLEITKQLAVLPTADIASQSLHNGFIVLVKDIEEAIHLSDIFAPEHLELHLHNASQVQHQFTHYGGLFVGTLSGEIMGDYGCGPNHVLPTGSTAKYSGGLSVFTFLRVRTWLEVSDAAKSQEVLKDVHTLAKLEGLHGHAAAAEKRFVKSSTESVPSESTDISRWIRRDFSKLGAYTPVQPLHILANEIGLPVSQLIKLDANENVYGPIPEITAAIAELPTMHIYPDPGITRLRSALATHVGFDISHVVAGSGSDDILEIIIRLVDPTAVLISTPTFGMYSFLGKQAKAKIVDIPRNESFGLDLESIFSALQKEEIQLIFLASPNNPTGNVVENSEVETLCQRADCLVVIDEAYCEFSGKSALQLVPKYPNLIIVRTFSKWAALAGLRVGYSISHPQIAQGMMSVKQPYNVNIAAEAAALAALSNYDKVFKTVDLLRVEKDRLFSELRKFKWLRPVPSEANFVLIEVLKRSATLIVTNLRAKGIIIRYFNTPKLQNYIRISAGRPSDTDALLNALREMDEHPQNLTNFKAQAILWDMDGVIADVSKSYRQAIIQTALHFGVEVLDGDISKAKSEGNSNNDWVLTKKLVDAKLKADIPLDAITSRFEEIYQGTESSAGLWEKETMIPTIQVLEELHSRVPFAVVTGRPRADAAKFLDHFKISHLFETVVCMEDGPKKPHPHIVQLAMKNLRVEKAVLIGDTPDDMVAANYAGAVPLGILSPGERGNALVKQSLVESGAALIIENLEQLLDIVKGNKSQ